MSSDTNVTVKENDKGIEMQVISRGSAQFLQVNTRKVSRSDKGAATLFYDTRYEQSEQARKEAEEKSKKAEEESKKTAAENEMLKRELEEYKKQLSQQKFQEIPVIVSPIMLAPQALSTSVESSNSAVVAPLPILIVANSGSVVSAHSVPSFKS